MVPFLSQVHDALNPGGAIDYTPAQEAMAKKAGFPSAAAAIAFEMQKEMRRPVDTTTTGTPTSPQAPDPSGRKGPPMSTQSASGFGPAGMLDYVYRSIFNATGNK